MRILILTIQHISQNRIKKILNRLYGIGSNIHYGCVGLSVGFSEKILLTGSAV